MLNISCNPTLKPVTGRILSALAWGEGLIVGDNVTVILRSKINLTLTVYNTGWEIANDINNKMKWLLQSYKATNCNLMAYKNYT